MKAMLIPTPTSMPISKGRAKQQMNVPRPGTKSVSRKFKLKFDSIKLLFVLHIGATTRISIIKITAAIMMPANVAFGMYEK
uniref:CSON004154 protein n=1 Tax=Culicoides sonorensis TaxID=179676 RepID=A0A336MNE1_CULSO